MNNLNERQAIDINKSKYDSNFFTRIYERSNKDDRDARIKRLKEERTLNTKMTIGFKNFIRNNKLHENEKDNTDKNIDIKYPQDVIYTLHYLVDLVGEYILVDDIMDFSEIYYKTMNKFDSKKS
jgi:hypothetical protein